MPDRFDNSHVMEWTGEALRYLDQTRLPHEEVRLETRDYRKVIEALRTLQLRGAPLIGIAAAYATVLAARELAGRSTGGAAFRTALLDACDNIAGARPTAVNLFWSLHQCREIIESAADPVETLAALERCATGMHDDDARRCAMIGAHGADLIPDGAGIVTHCNTGSLATGGDGTALAVLRAAHVAGKRIHVYADETRPLFQGARLTMWELARSGIPATLITDSSAAAVFRSGRAQLALTGADRIARNGDTANKIGTYSLAIVARHHGMPMYIAAPLSTFDAQTHGGEGIPIEERAETEVTHAGGVRIAPENTHAWSPAFDVTPAELVSAFITERGIIAPPFAETLAGILA